MATGLLRKKCSQCKRIKTITRFSKDNRPRYKDKRRSQCKNCVRKKRKEWIKKNPIQFLKQREKAKEYSREWARKHPENSHKHKLKNRYGLSMNKYEAMFKSQKGVCAICKKPELRKGTTANGFQHLSVDHCHKKGINRGLLCNACNLALGYFADNIAIMKSAIFYIESFEKKRLMHGRQDVKPD